MCCHAPLAAVKPPAFTLSGISGDVLANVQFRLTELYQHKSIAYEPLEVIKTQVAQAMEPYGYFAPQISISTNVEGNSFHIVIIPGPQMRINHLSIKIQGEGANNPEIVQTFKDLPLKEGDFFNNQLYEEAKDNLYSAAEHQGYLHSSFIKSEVLVDRSSYKADIILIFDTGPQYYFGQIQFDPTYISPELLNRYVPFKFGEPYSTDQILALNSNLAASGYFNSVVVKPNTKEGTYVPVKVHLKRTERINYSLGIGYGTDTGPRGRAGLHIVPVNRSGHKFNAIIQGSFKQNAILAQYLIPGKNPVTDNYAINGSFSTLNYPVGYSNSLLFSLAQQHSKTNFQRVISLNALDERFSYEAFPFKRTKNALFPKASFTWRAVEDQLFSPSGYNISLNALGASKAVLSDISFIEGTIDAKAALYLNPIRTRLYFHGEAAVTEISSIYDLPLSLAPLLGGAENLKAYSFNSIGPGKYLTFAGLEIQKETFEKWYVVGFMDGGDVYNPSIKHFKYDAGVGLMWVSPVGPIKIGVAQAIDQDFHRYKDRSPKLVINMGPDL